MAGMRTVGAGIVGVVAGAALAAGQVFLADRTGIADLGAAFEAGNERVEGVPVTMVAWFCAVAVVVALLTARDAGRFGRAFAAVTAAVGAAVAHPLVGILASEQIRAEAQRAVLVGAVLGLAVGLIAALTPTLALGVAVHAGLWWVFALVAVFTTRTARYAGLVELLDLLAVRQALINVLPGDRILSYHLPYLLPSIVLVVVAGVAVALVARRRRKAGRAAAILAGSGGALLAAAAFAVLPEQLTMWNGEVAVLAGGAAALTVLVTSLVMLVGRGAR